MMHPRRYACIVFIQLVISVTQAFDANEDIYFELYTPEIPDNYQIIRNVRSIQNTAFDPRRPTRIFIHGFRSERALIKQYANAYLKSGNFNFIATNWIDGAETFAYPIARLRIDSAAATVAELIEGLADAGMNVRDLVVIGHSLGAHIAGLAGKKLTLFEKIGAIIGLDPAAVLFNINETQFRLAHTDAEYVQVIHTDLDGGRFSLGIQEPLGHADFYPNYGRLQPGCFEEITIPIVNLNVGIPGALRSFGNKIVGCSHGRANEFFLESLTNKFPSIQCSNYAELVQNRCTVTGVVGNMGGDFTLTTERPRGIFYLETKSEPPYAISDVNQFRLIEINVPNRAREWLSKTLDVARGLLRAFVCETHNFSINKCESVDG